MLLETFILKSTNLPFFCGRERWCIPFACLLMFVNAVSDVVRALVCKCNAEVLEVFF